MTDLSPTNRDEAQQGYIDSLRVWQNEGVARPMIPVHQDTDQDGRMDFVCLSALGQLRTIDASDPDFALHTDVSRSTGNAGF